MSELRDTTCPATGRPCAQECFSIGTCNRLEVRIGDVLSTEDLSALLVNPEPSPLD